MTYSGGIGRGWRLAIRNSPTATSSSRCSACVCRQRSIARAEVRAASPRSPSSRSTMRWPFAFEITSSYQARRRMRSGGAWYGPLRLRAVATQRTYRKRFSPWTFAPPFRPLVVPERPSRAHLLDLLDSVCQRDPAFDPLRVSDPSQHGWVAPGPDRASHMRIGVVVNPTHPDSVLAVPFRHWLTATVSAPLNPVDEYLSHRPQLSFVDFEPLVIEDRVEFGHAAVDPVYRST